jgi:hypothetical protein
MRVRELRPKDVTFSIECHPEDESFVGNCSAINPEADARAERWIQNQLDRGNEWAWCYVVVAARWGTFCGEDGLGHCSYRSEADFKRGGYWTDMKAQALEELNNRVREAAEQLAALEVA